MPIPMRFIFVILGFGVLAASLWTRYLNRKAASWPGAEGRIIESRLERDAHDAESAVLIAYTFCVGERTFRSNCVAFTSKSDRLPAKEKLVAKYPVDKRVIVYFDPTNPHRSVLERQQTAGWLALAAAGAASIAFGLLSP